MEEKLRLKQLNMNELKIYCKKEYFFSNLFWLRGVSELSTIILEGNLLIQKNIVA